MESIKVTTEDLRNAASTVDNLAIEYDKEYAALFQDVETLTSTDYTGEDASAFRSQVEGFRDDFNKMKQLMNEYADYLRQAASSYEDAQANVKNTIASLQN